MSNNTWTHLTEERYTHNWTLIQGNDEQGLPMTLFAAIAFFVLILFAAMACGLIRLCRKEDTTPYDERPQYSVAISNRLFKDDTPGKDLPCLNCRLIEMGEMACYEETCPQCGKIPPSKKLMYEAYEEKKRQLEQKRKKKLQQVHQQANRAALQNQKNQSYVSESHHPSAAAMVATTTTATSNGKTLTTTAAIVQSSDNNSSEQGQSHHMDSKV